MECMYILLYGEVDFWYSLSVTYGIANFLLLVVNKTLELVKRLAVLNAI